MGIFEDLGILMDGMGFWMGWDFNGIGMDGLGLGWDWILGFVPNLEFNVNDDLIFSLKFLLISWIVIFVLKTI